MKTFSSKLLYYSMYQYITKVLPTIFGNITTFDDVSAYSLVDMLSCCLTLRS